MHERLHEQIAVAALPAKLAARAELAKTAAAKHQPRARRACTRGRDEVQGTTEHARAEPVGQVAAIDLDRFGLARVGKTDHIRAIGAIDRQAIAQGEKPRRRVLCQPDGIWMGLVVAPKTLDDYTGSSRARARVMALSPVLQAKPDRRHRPSRRVAGEHITGRRQGSFKFVAPVADCARAMPPARPVTPRWQPSQHVAVDLRAVVQLVRTIPFFVHLVLYGNCESSIIVRGISVLFRAPECCPPARAALRHCLVNPFAAQCRTSQQSRRLRASAYHQCRHAIRRLDHSMHMFNVQRRRD